MSADPMPTIKGILGFPTEDEDETVIENRDLLTVARLNTVRAEQSGDADDDTLMLAFTQATIAAATEARLANRLKWIEMFPHTRLAQQYRTEIEEAL